MNGVHTTIKHDNCDDSNLVNGISSELQINDHVYNIGKNIMRQYQTHQMQSQWDLTGYHQHKIESKKSFQQQ